MSNQTLNLDKSKSIRELGVIASTKYPADLISQLIMLVKRHGKNNGMIYQDALQLAQYYLPIQYLGHVLGIYFEFDHGCQFLNIVFYGRTQEKTYLRLFLSINDDPTIKYLENDHTGFVPSYLDAKIKLKPGEYLVNFAHRVLSYIGFNRCRLDDDSYLIQHKSAHVEVRTKLWLYYILRYGKSWYAKFGYEPANCSVNEYQILIRDVQNIRLDEVTNCLTKVLSAKNKSQLDPNLVVISQTLVDHIGDFTGTLKEYTVNQQLSEYTTLSNNLIQSIFSKKALIDNGQKYSEADFFWYQLLRKLLISNIMQVNNTIEQHCYQIQT